MKHIVIDLEMNKIARSSEARKNLQSEIIEIGAVMLDENPAGDRELPYICKTGIQR